MLVTDPPNCIQQLHSVYIDYGLDVFPHLQTTTFAYINVGDANDNAPRFTGTPYNVNITEGPDSNSKVVVIVNAEDGDTGVNGDVIYTIIRGNDGGEFVIDSTTVSDLSE